VLIQCVPLCRNGPLYLVKGLINVSKEYVSHSSHAVFNSPCVQISVVCFSSRQIPLLSRHPALPERSKPRHAAVPRVRCSAVQRRPVRRRRRVRVPQSAAAAAALYSLICEFCLSFSACRHYNPASFLCRYVNETAELITKLLEEIVLDLAAVKNADMALHLAVAMLQVTGKRCIIHPGCFVNNCFLQHSSMSSHCAGLVYDLFKVAKMQSAPPPQLQVAAAARMFMS
jgi:hypothetical protein